MYNYTWHHASLKRTAKYDDNVAVYTWPNQIDGTMLMWMAIPDSCGVRVMKTLIESKEAEPKAKAMAMCVHYCKVGEKKRGIQLR